MSMLTDLKSEIKNADGVISTQVAVPPDAVWFDGHFPDEAILPGVAQLAIVVEILCNALKKRVGIDSVRRVRFKQVIVPDEPITVEITPKQDNALSCGFRLLKTGGLACSGFIELSEIK